MKVRVPLYAKILLWFALNLLLVGALLYAFARVQFHLGFDSLLAGRAGDRIESVASVIASELRESPAENGPAILQRFSESYRVQFLVCRMDGEIIFGEKTAVPPPVRVKMEELRARNPAGRGPGPEAPFRDEPREPRPPPQRRNPPRQADPPRPRTMVHTTDPSRYWLLIPLRLPGRPDEPGPPRSMPAMLLAVSDSMSGNGLFFEWKPWLAVGAGVLLVSLLCWLPFVRGMTGAILSVTEAAARIAEGRFDVRLAENRRDEIGALAGGVNRMAARLEGFVAGQKRFLGDTAHELCAPIARLQIAAGILEQRVDEDDRSRVADLREEIDQISALVNELLSFSRASLAGDAVKLRAVELKPLVEQAVHREGAEISIDVPAPLAVEADPDLLLRALSNVLRNAVRYAADAGEISVSASRENAAVLIRIADCGPGISAEALPRVFDPFYRDDVSRDRATGGVGLGLAIVKTCIESCGGTVTCRNREPSGLEITIALRAAARE